MLPTPLEWNFPSVGFSFLPHGIQRDELHQICTVSPLQQILWNSIQNHWKTAFATCFINLTVGITRFALWQCFTIRHRSANSQKFSWKLTKTLTISCINFHLFTEITYNSYLFEYSSFCFFGIFHGVCKCYSLLSCHCSKWHLDSESVRSATLSPNLLLA